MDQYHFLNNTRKQGTKKKKEKSIPMAVFRREFVVSPLWCISFLLLLLLWVSYGGEVSTRCHAVSLGTIWHLWKQLAFMPVAIHKAIIVRYILPTVGGGVEVES